MLGAATEAGGQRGQKCGGPPVAANVSGLHVHGAATEPTPGEKALEACTHGVRKLMSRTRGVSLGRVMRDLPRYLDGWYAYFGFTEAPSSLKERDSWSRRRLRCYRWKQWGRRQDRELRRRGVSRDLAWNTGKSAPGPWHLSRSPARTIALPGRYFDGLGVPRLHRSSRR
jgi:RNA-directed DNA polymerase